MFPRDIFEPNVDHSTTLVCVNEQCENYQDEEWNPKLFSEFQGDYPIGCMVEFYDEDSLCCEFCGHDGREV